MSKKRISASVDSQVHDYVDRVNVNTSGLVNKLLRQHMNGGTSEEQMLEFRIDQVQSEVDDLEARLENKRDELDELKDRRETIKEEMQKTEEKALEVLSREDFEYQTQKTHYWADQLGMDVDDFVEEYKDNV